nr:hypothetical protein CFP56_37692 [Quercus suber]
MTTNYSEVKTIPSLQQQTIQKITDSLCLINPLGLPQKESPNQGLRFIISALACKTIFYHSRRAAELN